jgi:hypothetical protein
MRPATTRRARCRRGGVPRWLAGLLLAGLVLTGCSGLPESGPVVDGGASSTVDDERASDINAVPPTPGMTPSAVVNGFLDAMYASPIRIDVAKEYLTPGAATEWDPEAGTITYLDRQQPRSDQLQVSVELVDAEHLDRSGGYDDAFAGGLETLRFDLDLEDGEYRIDNPPDALVVPRAWFTQRFQPASLYFFDPSGRILVPQPVYVPRGKELPATLVRRLVQGAGDSVRSLVRSYLPTTLDPRVVDVSVSPTGVAEIDLGGESTGISEAASERLLAQLAWTLRQQPGVRGIRVTLGGAAVLAPGGDEVYGVSAANPYSPNGPDPSTALFAVRDHVLQRRDGNELRPVRGVLGSGDVPVSTATPNIDATRAAAVLVGRRDLVVADLADQDDAGGGTRPGKPEIVLRGTSLLSPAWDFADRIWVVDRTKDGAVVHVVVDGRDRVVQVSGVSGHDVDSFLVSRDGTRFVAVVRGTADDDLRVGRVEADGGGDVVRVRSTRVIDVDPGASLRIEDIAWTSPTTLAVLSPLGPGQVYGVRRIGVDGSPSSAESLPTPVTGPVIGLAGSPVTTLPLYVVTRDNLVDLTDGGSYGFVGAPATSVRYAG